MCFFRSHIRIYHVCSYLLPIPLSLHCPEKTKVSPADVVRFLVANGANTEAKDEDGMKLRCKIWSICCHAIQDYKSINSLKKIKKRVRFKKHGQQKKILTFWPRDFFRKKSTSALWDLLPKDGLKPGHGAETFQCAALLGGGGTGHTDGVRHGLVGFHHTRGTWHIWWDFLGFCVFLICVFSNIFLFLLGIVFASFGGFCWLGRGVFPFS